MKLLSALSVDFSYESLCANSYVEHGIYLFWGIIERFVFDSVGI